MRRCKPCLLTFADDFFVILLVLLQKLLSQMINKLDSHFYFIEQATDPSLDNENWALNMEVCDLINESSDNARDAMKAIKKRFSQYIGKNYSVIL